MKIIEAIRNIQSFQCPAGSPPVIRTAAEEMQSVAGLPKSEIRTRRTPKDRAGVCTLAVSGPPRSVSTGKNRSKKKEEFVRIQLKENGSCSIIASKTHFLFSFIHYLLRDLADADVASFRNGRRFVPAFDWQRISYDFFLTQEGRIQRRLNRETYIRELARLGFTHIEVNGLAFPMSLETGPKGETYPMFYTYCPAIDQFVSSRLNKGLYPHYYLSANLSCLKSNARLAVKYGLTPGLLCFEPRSVPEAFFARYPMLRGARVDHPFRSFKPRYNMTITQPIVREHYVEMMEKLMTEVPELGFLCIWTNDSGAGFEHTKSLYVGRNGGAYLIREWKGDDEIARLAGENALCFFRTLRDAAQQANPEFRVLTRMESFYGEHDTIWKGLGDCLDVETASLIARGWELPYAHPRYPENAVNAGTVYQNQFDKKEIAQASALKDKDALAHFYFSVGPYAMFAPLLGIPYPRLTYQRLKMMRQNGVRHLAHSGGTCPPELVPFNVNHEIVRAFQFDPDMNIDKKIEARARAWAGDTFYKTLVQSWESTEEAVLAFPNTTPLYSTIGFTWYRLWIRPLVPNIEAIPQDQRVYYEDFMCTTPHNPNNVDLSRDVLFQLTTPEKCRRDVERIDRHLWAPLERAIQLLERIEEEAQQLGKPNVIHDQLVRLRALHSWFMTQRNVAAWIACVHGYMKTNNASNKNRMKRLLKEAMQKEIKNSMNLLDLLKTDIEFMATTDMGETPLIHGSNMAELLQKRIKIMREHMEDEPFIDPKYIENKAKEYIL